ncbi:MAG: hypothetical protein AAB263_19020, partial [Planctomycetota bacterium]
MAADWALSMEVIGRAVIGWQQAAGSRQQAAGSRQQAAASSQQPAASSQQPEKSRVASLQAPSVRIVLAVKA